MPAGYLYTELVQTSNALLCSNGATVSHYRNGDGGITGTLRFSLGGGGVCSSSSLNGEEAIIELLDFVWRKYERTDSDPFVKIKCLRLLKHLCESGHERIRELIRRKYIQKIKTAQTYRGPPHPLQGDAPSARVREEAMACLRALYAHEGEDAAAVAAAVEATRSRIEGFGSEDCWSSSLPPGNGRAAAVAAGGLQQQQRQQHQLHAGKGDRYAGNSFYSPSASMSYVNSNVSSRNSSGSYSAAAVWGAAAGGGMRPAMPGFGNPAFARQNAAAAATPGEQALYLISSTASKIIPAGVQQQLQRVVNAALPVAGLQSHSALPRSGQRGTYGSSGSRGGCQSDRSSPDSHVATGGFYRAPPRPGTSSSSSSNTSAAAGSSGSSIGTGDIMYGGLNWQSDSHRSKTLHAAGASLSPKNGINRCISQGLPAGQYEERVVSAFLIPCGATLLPSRAVLHDFCCRCQSFDAPVLGAVLVEKLSDTSLSTASRLRLLAGSEALLKQEEVLLQQQQQEVEGGEKAAAVTLKSYLLEHAKQQLLQCLDTPQLRKVAAQVLLLIGESRAAAAEEEEQEESDQQQRRTRGKTREGEVRTAEHTATGEIHHSAGITTADTPNLLDIAAEDSTPQQQQRDLLDTDAAVTVPAASDSEGLFLLIGDSSSGDSNRNCTNSITDGNLSATALNASSAHTTASFNSLPHADEVNIVLADELQRHTPFSSLPSLFSLNEATSATGNSSQSAAAAARTDNSSSDTAPPAPAQSPLLAQLKKRETRTRGSVFSGLTVKRPAADAASTSPPFSSAVSTSAGATPASSVGATTAAAAAPRVAAVEPLDLLSSAAGLADVKRQQKQQQQLHALLSPVGGEATAAKEERILLNSIGAPHRNAAAAAVDMLSLDQALCGNVSPLSTSAAAGASGAAAPAAGGASAAATSYFPSTTFTSQALAFTSRASTLQQQQQQLRSIDAASRTAHLDRFFGRLSAAAGAAAVPPHVSDVEQQQQSTLVQTVQHQQAVIQKLQEQQQQMLLLLQEKQEQKKGAFPADVTAVDAMHFPSPLHSPAISGRKAGGTGEGAAGVTEKAVQSSLLLPTTRSSGSSHSSSTAEAARAAGGAAHGNSGSTFEEAVAASAAPRSSKFAFVKS